MTPARDYLAPIGHGDCAPLIKIIEKVRADALEEAARVAEAKYAEPGWHCAAKNAGLGIASAIRALGAPQKPALSDQAFVCRHGDPRCEDDPCPAGIRWMCDASAIRNLGDKA